MILSILIPSIPSRFNKMINLYNHISGQIKDKSQVEILIWIDNKNRSIGQKRNDLVQMAKGKYLTFVDDDDNVSTDYIDEMLKGCQSDKDVICFRQLAIIDDIWSYVDFSIINENQEIQPSSITRRKPFHVCAIRSDIAKKYTFPDVGYGEDWYWMEQVLRDIKTEYKTDKVLHFYRFKKEISEAPTESNSVWKNLDYEKSDN